MATKTHTRQKAETRPRKCVKCQQEFDYASTPGRPPAYCSTGCRRAAGYEIGRINKRLLDLEDDIRAVRLGFREKVDDEEEHQRVQKIHGEIRMAEERLHELLEAGG